jgi:hypothetical protein
MVVITEEQARAKEIDIETGRHHSRKTLWRDERPRCSPGPGRVVRPRWGRGPHTPQCALASSGALVPNRILGCSACSCDVRGSATSPGRLDLMLSASDGEARNSGCLPVAVMVGEDAR